MRTNYHRGLAATLVLLVGCADSGPDRAEVFGTVLLDGQPVKEGSINFIPIEGTKGPGAGGVISDGHYLISRANGVTVGKNRVELRAFKMTGRKVQDPTGRPGVLTAERVSAFPPEYNDKSTLVRDIHSGPNEVNFDVRTRGKAK